MGQEAKARVMEVTEVGPWGSSPRDPRGAVLQAPQTCPWGPSGLRTEQGASSPDPSLAG